MIEPRPPVAAISVAKIIAFVFVLLFGIVGSYSLLGAYPNVPSPYIFLFLFLAVLVALICISSLDDGGRVVLTKESERLKEVELLVQHMTDDHGSCDEDCPIPDMLRKLNVPDQTDV